MTGTGAGFNPVSWSGSSGYAMDPENMNVASVSSFNSAKGFNIKDVDENNVLDYLKSRDDEGSRDYYIEYLLKQLSENSAREYNAQREDTYYQRLMEDLRKAGISPYGMSIAGAPINGAQSYGVSGNNYTSARKNLESIEASKSEKVAQIAGSLFSAIAVALIMAFA